MSEYELTTSYAIGIDINDIEHKWNAIYNAFLRTCYISIECDNILKTLIINDKNNQLITIFLDCVEILNIKIIECKNIETFRYYNTDISKLDFTKFKKLQYISGSLKLENKIKLPKHKLKILYE